MKSVRPVDWAYLFVSFALSLYLIERQYEDNTFSDSRIRLYQMLIRACRKVNIAAMEMELLATTRINDELERRI